MPNNKKKKTKKAKGGAGASRSYEQLCEHAEQCLVHVEPQSAIPLLEQALQLNSQGTVAMDLLAQAFLELGQPQDALPWLEKSTQIAPDDNYHKWMSSGQISSGFTAIRCFQKGVEMMEEERKNATGEEAEELRMEVSNAYCAMAEIFVTDLCDESVAESECERLLLLAVQACDTNPAAHYAVANLRMIQKRKEDAQASLKRTVEILQDESEDWGFEVMLNTAKACFEMEQHESACALFERLLGQDDRFVEIWYLTGACYAKLGGDGPVLAKQYFQRAKTMMEMSMGASSSSSSSSSSDLPSVHLPDGADEQSKELYQKIDQALQQLPDGDDQDMS